MFNYQSKEFFINMKPSDIPPKGHSDRKAFIDNEINKSIYGITVNGIFIPGGLYWEFNHWKIPVDIEVKGVIKKEILTPQLRDNSWIIHNAYEEATKQKKILVIGGARQISKTVTLTSLLGRQILLFENTNSLGLYSNTKDIEVTNAYLDVGLANVSEFLSLPVLDKDPKKGLMRIGFKQKDNTNYVYSSLYLRNTDEGKNTEIGAGLTLNFFAFDEIAKHSCAKAIEAVKPALISEFGWRCAPLFCFTGGNVEKSKDAENFFMFPEANNVLPFENEGKKTGLFIGGWYRQDFKRETSLSKYLNVEQGSELDEVKIKVTDFEKANAVLDQEQLDLSKDPDKSKLLKHRMYFPRSIQEMFLSESENPYPRELVEQQIKLLESNPVGTAVDLYRDNSTKEVKHKLSSKLVNTQFPNPDWKLFQDAPIVIYDFPNKYKETYGLHFLGGDTYNDDEVSHSDSLGSIHVYRKEHSDLTDNYRGCMVASYTGRPKSSKEFNEIFLMLAEFYNGLVLYEHVTPSLLEYFNNKNKAHMLIDTYDLQKTININTKTQNKKGLKPTIANQKFLLNSELGYLTEELEDGYGIRRIYDLYLLRQYLVDRDKNTDAIISNQHAIAGLNMFAKMNVKIDDGQEYEYNPIRNAFGFGMKSSSGTKKQNAFGI